MRQSHWLKIAAIGTWVICGLPSIAGDGWANGSPNLWWAAGAFGAYGIALVIALWCRAAARGVATGLVVIQTAAAVTLNYLTGPSAAGTGLALFVIVAAQLPHLVKPSVTWSWIAGQTIVVALLWSGNDIAGDVLRFSVAIAGFQIFAAVTTSLMLGEAAARWQLAQANAQLQITRALLAENSRAGERLRIARDLHDTLGHHLTALNLQLEVASHLADGRTADHVSQAHAISRLLLSEVRNVVSAMRENSKADFAQMIRTLASDAGSLAVHVDMPDHLIIDDAQAHALLRCVQEIITNTARHANAHNLWIRIEPTAAGITLSAHDDGRGGDTLQLGNGLKGIRERFEEFSGSVDFYRRAGEGFQIHGFMPAPQVTS